MVQPRRYVQFEWFDLDGEYRDSGLWDAEAPVVGEVVTIYSEDEQESGRSLSRVLVRGKVAFREWVYYPTSSTSGVDEWGAICRLEPSSG